MPVAEPAAAAPSRPALTGAILHRSARAALVVGTLLTALNQGDLLLQGIFPPALWWKVPLTYLVPFLVATYGALGAQAPLPVEPSKSSQA